MNYKRSEHATNSVLCLRTLTPFFSIKFFLFLLQKLPRAVNSHSYQLTSLSIPWAAWWLSSWSRSFGWTHVATAALLALTCSRFVGMAASPACAPGLISGPTLPPQPVTFRCYWAQKPSYASSTSRRPRRRRFVPVAAASTRASPAAARGLDADDFRHPLDKQASFP